MSTAPVFSLEWLTRYKISVLPADLLAGMTVLLMGVLILFTDLFKNLPEAVLAAVVIVAVKVLFNPKEVKNPHSKGADSLHRFQPRYCTAITT